MTNATDFQQTEMIRALSGAEIDAVNGGSIIDSVVAAVKTMLDGRAQALSDLSAKFQFQLSEAN